MYTIFDLAFDKKSRTSRFIYSILHAETRYLTNSMRVFIKDKNIDIYAEQQFQNQSIQNALSDNSKTIRTESQQQSQAKTSLQDDSSVEQSPSANSEAPELREENKILDENE